MDSYRVWNKLRSEHNTVEELENLIKPSLDKLETIADSLGKDAVEALQKKRGYRGGGVDSGPDYTEEEQAYIDLEKVIDVYNEAIKERKELDLALVNPKEFKGFIDVEATKSDELRFAPPHKQITLFEPYAKLFKGLKKLRQQMGRNEITDDEVIKKAKSLWREAGFRDVIVAATNVTPVNAVFEQIKKDVDSLGYQADYSGCYDGGDHSSARAELQSELNRFLNPIRNSITLKPIPPVEVEFEKAVDTITRSIAVAVLGEAPDWNDKNERPTITTARNKLAQMATQSPKLSRAVQDFLLSSEAELRDEGHLVLKREKPKTGTKSAAKIKAP